MFLHETPSHLLIPIFIGYLLIVQRRFDYLPLVLKGGYVFERSWILENESDGYVGMYS